MVAPPPTYPGEVVGVAAAVEEVHHHLSSVEEVGEGEGEGVRVVWSVGAVEEGEGVRGSTVPWTEGGVVVGECSAEVEVQASTCSVVAEKGETVVGVTQFW